MKDFALLAFVAFIAAVLPNLSEGKCYACGGSGFGSCEEFARASVEERKKKFTIDSNTPSATPLDCSRCMTKVIDEEFIRFCAPSGLNFCEGDFCNGPNDGPASLGSTGKCYICEDPPIGQYKSCQDFESASAEEKKEKFSMEGESLSYDCNLKKCQTKMKEGKVVSRSCSLKGVDYCEGDYCNGPTAGEGTGDGGSSDNFGRCYSCSLPPKSCEDFDRASDLEREIKFIQYSDTPIIPPSDCSKCIAQILNGKVVSRGCIIRGFDTTKEVEAGGVKSHFCKGDLCNGGNAKSFGSNGGGENLGSKGSGKNLGSNGGDVESFDGAGSLRSWSTATLLTTAASILKGPLF